VEGACVFSGPKMCNDGDECTDDGCDPALGCLFALNQAPCDDGDICTLADHCQLGECAGTVELVCDDGDPCTDDSCNSQLGCQFVFNDAPCDDADPCTLQDTCAGGICAGQPKDCDDGNPCSDDWCGPGGNCVSEALDDGGECGDGPQWQCLAGECTCFPQCDGKECGDNLCGGSCGGCGDGQFCFVGACYYPLTLADTGQEKCYDNTDEPIPCPEPGEAYFGQDGSYVGTPMSFADNGDGTVTDNVTNLVWAKCSAGQDAQDCSGAGAALEWLEAMDHCEQNLDDLPGEGWRLPNRLELLSITDFQKPHCMDKDSFGGEVVAGYWSSTTGGSQAAVCGVSFGTCASGCAYQKQNAQTFFRCVRGGPQSGGDFSALGDGTVRDQATGLYWQQLADPQQRNCADALTYCEDLELAGHDGWRLPNVKEAATLVDFSPPNLIAAEAFFGETPSGGFWTSTTFRSWTSRGFVLKGGGALGDFGEIKTKEHFVRCVRGDCQPDCADKVCGDDGCGGSCGECSENQQCEQGLCVTPAPTCLWSSGLGGGQGDFGHAVAAGVDGSVYVAGVIESPGVQCAGQELAHVAGQDVLLVKYNDGGAPAWCSGFGGYGDDRAQTADVGFDGNIVVGGYFTSPSLSFGDGPVLFGDTGGNGFVVELGPDGDHNWSRSLSGSATEYVNALATDSAGNTYLCGPFASAVLQVGDEELSNVSQGLSHDVFVVKLNLQGEVVWAGAFGSEGSEECRSIAIGPDGDVYVAGEFYSAAIDFGGGPLDNIGPPESDCFVARFSSQGDHVWSVRFGSESGDVAEAVSVGNSGQVSVAGRVCGDAIDLGTGPLPAAGGCDAFVVQLDDDGKSVWAKLFGGTSGDMLHAASIHSSGIAYVAGFFDSATIDFGGGPVQNLGTRSAFVTKLGGDGEYLWSKVFGGNADDAYSVFLGPTQMHVTGWFKSAEIDVGCGPISNSGGFDMFVATFSL